MKPCRGRSVGKRSLEKGFLHRDSAGPPTERLVFPNLQALNLSPLVEQLLASGASADVVNEIINTLGGTIGELGVATSDAAVDADVLTTASRLLAIENEATKGALNASRAAAQAYNDKIKELNEARIDGLKRRVDEAKSALDVAGQAADTAKQKVIEFLTGPPPGGTTQQAIDATILQVDSLASGLAELIADNPLVAFGDGIDASNVRDKIFDINVAVAGLLADAPTREKAEEIANGLKAGLESQPYGELVTDAIDTQLALWDPEAPEIAALFDAETVVTEAQTALDNAELSLEVGLTLPTSLFTDSWQDEANTAATDAAQDVIDGWVNKFDGNTDMQDALRTKGEDAIQEFLTSVGTNSPSTISAQAGVDVARGFDIGIRAGAGLMVLASQTVGRQAMFGLQMGLAAGSGDVYAKIRAIGQTMIQQLRDELKIESPSKVTQEIGEFFGEGLAEGIAESAPKVLAQAVSVANRALAPLTSAGRAAVKAIGRGIAEEGPSFIKSIGSAMDEALVEASSKAERFAAIGNQIALNLFSSQGVNAFGASNRRGGSVEAAIQKAYLDVLASTRGFGDQIRSQIEEFGASGRNIGLGEPIGEENRGAFLQAGLNIRNYVEQVVASGRSTNEAAAAAKFQRDQLIGQARALGLNRSAIDDLIRTLGLSNAQIDEWARSVRNAENAARAATEAERQRIAAEQAAAAQAANVAPETLQQPVFRDLNIVTPAGDPEAVALYVANRVALNSRR